MNFQLLRWYRFQHLACKYVSACHSKQQQARPNAVPTQNTNPRIKFLHTALCFANNILRILFSCVFFLGFTFVFLILALQYVSAKCSKFFLKEGDASPEQSAFNFAKTISRNFPHGVLCDVWRHLSLKPESKAVYVPYWSSANCAYCSFSVGSRIAFIWMICIIQWMIDKCHLHWFEFRVYIGMFSKWILHEFDCIKNVTYFNFLSCKMSWRDRGLNESSLSLRRPVPDKHTLY